MSHIFDALQRSEAERAETERAGGVLLLEPSTYSVATELLQIAERKRRGANAASERSARLLEFPGSVSRAAGFHPAQQPAGIAVGERKAWGRRSSASWRFACGSCGKAVH
jgi:hypothetical protein